MVFILMKDKIRNTLLAQMPRPDYVPTSKIDNRKLSKITRTTYKGIYYAYSLYCQNLKQFARIERITCLKTGFVCATLAIYRLQLVEIRVGDLFPDDDGLHVSNSILLLSLSSTECWLVRSVVRQ